MGFSPTPPPQAARAFVRQLFNRGAGLALLQLACGLIAFKKAHAARLTGALPG